MPRAGWVVLTLLATGLVSPAGAQPLAPISPLGPDSSGPPLRSTPVTAARDTDRLPPILGAPVGVGEVSPQPAPLSGGRPATGSPVQSVSPAGFANAPERQPVRAAGFGTPSAADGGGAASPPPAPVPATLVDGARTRTTYQQPAADPVNDFLTKRSELKDRDPPAGGSPKSEFSAGKFADDFSDKLHGMFGTNSGGWFRSDHMFDGFISPVSNPFLFEDPRSLTELRPIFIFQKVPTRQPDFHGGDVVFFGGQGRVAFTDQWSLVVNKFGGVSVKTNSPSPFPDSTGFAELWLGPKWTFYRGEETCSVAAAGLTFQIPTGSAGTFQNTHGLSLAPYVSYAQNFLRDFSLGSFNFLANTGFSFATDKARSDYYWLSAHLDLDVNNAHRWYPLFELNWLINTSNGHSTPIGAEGRDLINFGGHATGTGLLTAAFGGRVKITEAAQLGAAFEFPLAGRSDLFSYRFTIDFILRY